MRREVQGHLKLEPGEAALLDHHSLLNLCNVLEMQLTRLEERVSAGMLRSHSRFCLELILNLRNGDIRSHLGDMEAQCTRIRHDLQGLLESHPDEAGMIRGLLETVAVGHARIEEYKGNRLKWRDIPHEAFSNTLMQFLQATERVSEGRFRFTYAPEPREADAYWVDFRIDSAGDKVHAPGILHDTIRDLAGNARKYSHPGSLIRIELEGRPGEGLRLRVTDEGMGIPDEELEKVVQYGYRASNVLDKRTMGGGFGLTKAYNLCKRFQGQFFIESELGKGTTVEMTLFPPG